jgi:hypothetical protein
VTHHHDANESADDWTVGVAAFVVVSCPRCRQRWYLPRSCCPACGYDKPQHRVAKPDGVVAAATVVHRAPAPFGDAPYAIVLVDLVDGIRVMGRSEPTIRPGEHVTANFTGDPLLPYFRLIEAATADVHNRERSQTSRAQTLPSAS